MSEDKVKAPTGGKEEFETLDIPWNTSGGLWEACPGIEMSPGWECFAHEYDKPENQQQRLIDAANSMTPFYISPLVMELRELAEFILDEQSPTEEFVSSVIKGNSIESASKQLAKRVLELVAKPGDYARKFADEAEMFYDRNPPIGTNAASAFWAFFCFCQRERRLPKKKEINVEANRIENLISETAKQRKELKHGDLISGGKRFYSNVWTGIFHSIDKGESVHVCPDREWNETKWDTSNFTKALKRAGLGCVLGVKH